MATLDKYQTNSNIRTNIKYEKGVYLPSYVVSVQEPRRVGNNETQHQYSFGQWVQSGFHTKKTLHYSHQHAHLLFHSLNLKIKTKKRIKIK